MGSRDRRARILQRVDEAGVVRSAELAAAFQVSEMTVRRDLDHLAAENLVVRMRGGAARVSSAPNGRFGHAADGATIGIVFPDANHVYPAVVSAVEGVLKQARLSANLVFSHYDLAVERRIVDDLVDNGIDGLLFTPSLDEEQPDWEFLEWMSGLSIPLVLVERRLPDQWPVRSLPSVQASFTAGLATAVQHLCDLGHRRIAFFGHVARLDVSQLQQQWHALAEGYGLEVDSSPFLVDRAFKHWRSNAEPERVLDQVIDAGATALICRHDSVALTMAHHVRRRGMQIPADLSMVAYDDDVASMCDPPLTAISPPKAELGQLAARMLVDLVGGHRDGATTPTTHLELEPVLVVRDSTAAPRSQP